MKENDALRVLQFSDTHLSADATTTYYGVNTDESLGRVIRYALEHFPHVDLTLVTGDLVHDETAAGYERLKRHLQILKTPVFCLPGNHDNPEVMNRILSSGNISAGRSALKKTWQIILLDSTVPGEVGGRLSAHELDKLESLLSRHPDYHALVCLHHSPFLTGSDWLDSGLLLHNPDDLFAVIDRHAQVRGVLWGHIHQEFYLRRNNVEYYATPSTMVQFKPNCHDFTLDDKSPGFRWLDLHMDGSIETKVVYLQATD